ncbi:guanylate kinase [Methanococcus maripaludis]|uniref:Guanylate kinase n=1 Tax=Methanococcus maripaludis TaxID=39152 RepID=A0A7J9NWL3_METMI|nr:MW1434 family type I TA system toxin [Methanococcus maripaludis]MBA2851701.1 guanylate kinase [Methanococcus maripaludis]
MKPTVIVLFGKSGSGKSSVEKKLCEEYDFHKCISHTTRPIRPGEVDGVDYHFVDKSIFENHNDYIEVTSYNGNVYGLHKSEIKSDKINVVVMEPNGVQQITNNSNYNVIKVMIQVDDAIVIDRMRLRGDNDDDIFKRLKVDAETFKDAEALADFVIVNHKCKKTCNSIKRIINGGTLDMLSFGDALNLVQTGIPVMRNSWDNQYLYTVPANCYPAQTDLAKQEFGDIVPYEPYIAVKTTKGTVSIWAPTQEDMFAKDWVEAEVI